MQAKDEMLAAKEALASALDAKLKDMPEWLALRAIDRAIVALDRQAQSRAALPVPKKPLIIPTYSTLTLELLNQKQMPIATPELLDYVAARRPVDPNVDRARINLTSSLSKDERIRSISWSGGRAWWFADREPPTNVMD